ncbi:MAG: hypothetical protein AAGA56_31005, partial [Myxococcota bacterium]
KHVVVVVRLRPGDSHRALAMRLDAPRGPLDRWGVTRPRLIGPSDVESLDHHRAGLILRGKRQSVFFPRLDEEGVKLPRADKALLMDGAVFLARDGGVEFWRQNGERRGKPVPIEAGRWSLGASRVSATRRFWAACPVSDEPGEVLVVDATTGTTTVRLPRPDACFLDVQAERTNALYVRGDTVTLEGHPWDGGRSVATQWREPGAEHPEIGQGGFPGRLLVTLGGDDARQRLWFDADDLRRVEDPAKARGFASIPVGQMRTDGSKRALTPFAAPGQEILSPSRHSTRVWTANGARNAKGSLVAFYEGPIKQYLSQYSLVIATTSSRDVLCRLPLEVEGPNWLSGHFLNERFFIHQLYPHYRIVDTRSCAWVAKVGMQEGYALRMVGPALAASGPFLIDLRQRGREAFLPLGVAEPSGGRDEGGAYHALRRSSMTRRRFVITSAGKVHLEGQPPPANLHCVIGDFVVPWPVCRTRLLSSEPTPDPPDG